MEKRGIKGHQFEFLVNNTGTKEAFVIDVELRGQLGTRSLGMRLEELGAVMPIVPGQFRALWVFVPPYYVRDFLDWPGETPGQLMVVLRIQEYGGTTKTHSFAVDVSEYLQFRAATEDAFRQFRAGGGPGRSAAPGLGGTP